MKAMIISAEKDVARWLKNKFLSRQEVLEKLRGKNYPAEVIEAVLEKARPLLNDELLARNLIEHYQQKKFHPQLIREKLRQRQIPPELIDQLLSEKNPAEQDDILALIKKIASRYQKLSVATARRRIASYLTRHGYSPEDFIALLEKIFPDDPEVT